MAETTGNRILFLDIDGVLNAHDCWREAGCSPIHRDKVMLLNRILRETGCKICLSTAWRYICFRGEATLDGFAWILRSHGMMVDWVDERPVHRIVGHTRSDTMVHGPDGDCCLEDERGQQIVDWMIGPGWKHYGENGRHVVLDDLDLGISRYHSDCFVRTDGRVGLTEADANRAIDIFNRKER